MSDLELLLEGEKRGLLPPDKQALLGEARNRGLIPGGTTPPDQVKAIAAKSGDHPADWTPDQIDAYDKHTAFLKANPSLQGGYVSRMTNSAAFGAVPLINAGVQSALEYPLAALGGDTNLRNRFDKHFAEQVAAKDLTEKNTSGAGGVAADLVGGLALGAPKAVGSVAVNVGKRLPAWVAAAQGVKAGAGYGGAGAFIGSDSNIDTQEGLGNRLAAVPAGIAGGAVLGGALGGTLGAASNALANRVERKNALARDAQSRLQDFTDANIEPFNPALSQSTTVQKSARGLTDTMFGQPLKDAANRSITDTERRAQETLRRYTEGLPSSDLGEEAQGILKKKLTQYSIPDDEIKALSSADRERMTGPVTDTGFLPPRPVVEKMPPERISEVQPRAIASDSIRVPDQKVDARTLSLDDVIVPQTMQMRLENSQRRADVAKRMLENSKNEPLPKGWEDYAKHDARPLESVYYPHPYEVKSHFDRKEKYQRDIQDHQQLIQRIEQYKLQQLPKLQEAEFNRASQQLPTLRKQAMEQRRTELEAQAQQEARTQTETLREQARMKAERDHAERQSAADRAYDESIKNGETGFRTGRSQESYPTEFSAAYETANRETPRVQANPLLGPTQRKGDGQLQSATSRTLDEIGNEARGGLKLPGYKSGQPYDETGRIQPALMDHLRKLVGKDVADRLETLSERRATGQLVPDHSGMRSLRTELRRAAEEAEHPPYPAQARPDDAAALRRLYGALSEDMDRSLRNIGPEGVRAADMHKSVDTEYGRHAAEMRRPLAKLFGEKVSPIQAMDKISAAAVSGDLRLIRSYVRVMDEKANPTRAAAGIVAHLTEGAKDLPTFIKGFEKIPTDVRNELFRNPRAQEYRRDLEALERIGKQLMPYYSAAKSPGGIDLSKKSNLFLIATAWSHFYGTLSLGAGMAGVSRFMASPRYLNALIKIRPTPGSGFASREAAHAMGVLGAIASKDGDFGKEVLKAAQGMLGTSAKAAPTAAKQMFPKSYEPPADPLDDLSKRAGIDPAPYLKSGRVDELLKQLHDSPNLGSDMDLETLDGAAERYGIPPPWGRTTDAPRTPNALQRR